MLPEVPPTAEGDLARNPFAHLLVFALERKLTGAMFLTDPSGAIHTVRLARGVPVKVRPGDAYSLLGEMLVDGGHIEEAVRDKALDSKGQLGEVLVLAGKLDREVLEKTLEEQFHARMVHLFALPPKTKYKYFDGHHELVDWGAPPASVDPFKLVWAGIIEHGEKSAQMDGTLARLGDTEVRLHERADWRRFGFEDDALDVAELIALEPLPFNELVDLEADASLTRRVVYTLVMFRQIPIRDDLMPVEPLEAPAPKPSATSLGRVRLKTQAYRMGAAVDSSDEVVHREYIGSHRRKKSIIAPLDLKNPDGAPDSERASSPAPSSDRAPVSSVDATEPASSDRAKAASEAPPSSPEVPVSAPAESAPAESAPAESAPAESAPAESASAESAPAESAESAPAEAEPPPSQPEASKAQSTSGEAASGEAASGAAVAGADGAEPEPETPAEEKEDSALSGLSCAALLQLAETRLEQRDFDGASQATSAAIRSSPADVSARVLHIWAQAGAPGADTKTLTVQLDELLHEDEGLVDARFYRAVLRQKLGNDPGALSDLKRVLELSPSHEHAIEVMQTVQARRSSPPKSDSGLWSRLFRR